jgi:hypothetical protein
MTLRVTQGTVNAYQPAAGEPRNRFTIAATAARGTTPLAPTIRPAPHGIVVVAPERLASLLVRVPDGVSLVVNSEHGDVNVTDVSGPVSVAAAQGNLRIFLQHSFAQARVGRGNISIAMGATTWPGTLHVSTGEGDVQMSVEDKAAFTVHLYTANGTLFTDFDLRGTSRGAAETIDGPVNGGGAQRLDVATSSGSIRLLRLHAQP